MNKVFMMRIEGRAIELGEIPFNLYVRDHKGELVLFCRCGMPITHEHKAIIERRNSEFYVTSEEINSYLDYTMERMNSVITSPLVRTADKVKMVRDLGRRVLENFFADPRSGKHMVKTRQFVRTTVDFIMSYPEINFSLLNLSDLNTYLFSHGINSCVFSLLIGRKLVGEDREMLIDIGMGGMLLDVGMSRLDRSIFDKRDALSTEDWKMIRTHTRLGYDLLKDHKISQVVLDMVMHHHERLDGSGYPNGMTAAELSLPVRIASLVDVYDAMTSEREYRKAMIHVQALAEIAGSIDKYDFDIFRVLLDLVLQNGEIVHSFLEKHLPDRIS